MKTINIQSQSSTCAVVTAFSPDDGFPDRIARIHAQVQCVIIVDDGASDVTGVRLTRWFEGLPGIVLLHHASNRGVAAALNSGLELAGTMGFTNALLLDDDSVVASGMVAGLIAALEGDPNQLPAIVGTGYNSPGNVSDAVTSDRLKVVPSIITAGSLIPLKVFVYVGPFREELFIDYVDHEYCLRARTKGVRILQCEEVGMEQPIGQAQKNAWGELRSVHSQARTYYFFRNSFVVAREYIWKFPEFSIWVCWQQFKTLVKILFFMRPKRQYWRAMLRGLSDGWACRLGRISDGVLQ
jgi:rhamnosyltransferase